MYSKVCWLLLLLITAAVTVDCEVGDIPLIEWEEGCDDYKVTDGVHPPIAFIHSQYPTTLAQCRSLCTGRQDCGGFVWNRSSKSCYLRNINDHIIKQYLSWSWFEDSLGDWYSKTCDYNLGNTDQSCDIYTGREYHDQYPLPKWGITHTHPVPGLPATECQAWCTLHTGCRSFSYRRYHRDNKASCLLFKTTIQDLLDSGLDDDVHQNTWNGATYTTYDRYCGDGSPYVPDEK